MGPNLWNPGPSTVEVRSFPPNQASPPGVPDIYLRDVSYPQLGAGTDGFSTTDWVTIGLAGTFLVGLGVLLARS